jgi:hypothetical protein
MIKEKFDKLTPEHKKILLDIQKSVPLEWVKAVTERVSIAPVSEEIMKRALVDPEVSEETKSEFKRVIDSGFFEKKIDVEVELVAELIDAYVGKEIIKQVLKGKLPKMKKRTTLEVALKRFNKLLEQYEQTKNNTK